MSFGQLSRGWDLKNYPAVVFVLFQPRFRAIYIYFYQVIPCSKEKHPFF